MKVYNNILEVIGNTPLVRLKKLEEHFNVKSKLYAKLENFNPSNSIKTRPALFMFQDLIKRDIIDKDTVIIEATSGNTGIALAMISAYYGNKCILIMPDTLSRERIDYMKLYGAQIILTDGAKGINGSKEKAQELHDQILNSVIPSQFTNLANPESHYKTTAKEIAQALNNKVDYFFTGIGTGGTVTGNGRYFKQHGLNTKVIGVEPYNSSVLHGNPPGKHKIQGIGAGFIPEILDVNIMDDILRAKDEPAMEMTRLLPKLEGISIGISSGATIQVAIEYLKEHNIEGKNAVIMVMDSAEKYFSTGVFES